MTIPQRSTSVFTTRVVSTQETTKLGVQIPPIQRYVQACIFLNVLFLSPRANEKLLQRRPCTCAGERTKGSVFTSNSLEQTAFKRRKSMFTYLERFAGGKLVCGTLSFRFRALAELLAGSNKRYSTISHITIPL